MTLGVGVVSAPVYRGQAVRVNVSDETPNSISVMFGEELRMSRLLSRNAQAPFATGPTAKVA